MDSEKQSIRVLMFPFLAHGHISPFLELAKRLSHRNFHIHLCSTPINLSSIKNSISGEYSGKIQLIELHLPSLPELPPHYHTSNGLPLHLNHLLHKVLKIGKPNFAEILQILNPDLLIQDVFQPWAGSMASRLNIPSVTFSTGGATTFSYFCHLYKHPGKEFPFPEIRLTELELSMATKILSSSSTSERDADDNLPEGSDLIMLKNSCRVMEGKYIDYLTELMSWSIIPVGALIQESNLGGGDYTELMGWLGEKDAFSSVFVSFGSEYFLNEEEIEEIAYGLELSSVNFIWVIRFEKGDETRAVEVLPEGFLERVGERGRVLDKWAPQRMILRHSSIGGFVSHCGWNSILESIDFGVPVIAMPMHLDQPVNAKLVAELGVGVEVKKDVEGMFRRDEISKAIKSVVFEEKGKQLRTKIGQQRESIRSGSSEEIDGAAQKLREICGKNRDSQDTAQIK